MLRVTFHSQNDKCVKGINIDGHTAGFSISWYWYCYQ